MSLESELTLSGLNRWGSRRARALAFLSERGLSGAFAEIRRVGLRGSSAFVRRNLRYTICILLARRWDAKHGVDTGGHFDIANLKVVGPNAGHGYATVSTSPRSFDFFRRFLPDDVARRTYVDLGCGKGRTLLLASRLGFKRLVGVEFADDICPVARKNLAAFDGGVAAPWEIVHGDATQFELPHGPLVIYFGNPFRPELWPAMIANLKLSHAAAPRPIRLIVAGSIANSLHTTGALIAGAGGFVRVAQGTAPFFLDTYLPYHYDVFDMA